MFDGRKLISRNTLLFNVSAIVPALAGLIALPLITNSASPSEFGILSIVNIFNIFVSAVLGFQLHLAISRLFFEHNETLSCQKEYFSTLFYGSLGLSVFGFGLFLVFGQAIIDFVFPTKEYNFFPLFGVGVLTTAISVPLASIQAFMKAKKNAKNFLLVQCVNAAIYLTAICILSWKYEITILNVLISGLIAKAISALTAILINTQYFVYKLRFDVLFSNMKFGSRLIPHALGGSIFLYGDLLVIEHFLTLAAVGIYAIASKISKLLKIYVNSFSSAISPFYMQYQKMRRFGGVEFINEISRVYLVSIGFGYSALCGVAFVFFEYVFGVDYIEARTLIPIISFAFVMRGLNILLLLDFYFAKRTLTLSLVTVVCGAFNVATNIILIPKLGVLGAALTTAFSFLLNFAILFFLTPSKARLRLDRPALAFLFVSCSLVALTVLGHGHLLNLQYPLPVVFGLLFVFVLWGGYLIQSDWDRLRRLNFDKGDR